ncbi:Zinc finger, RING/FYVE/PHD-type [Cynara cardunculus var. scolymus]|uniref:RING-type E3 ubiquitin transferase n=1 Tax=Cynara cardunculus var. scolymus TaxID=59895 RepID=A0A103XFN9_CYNCS|nr:Zinc finger, RING/FYVE/PHD-type [Cynara cardunculus var. scolymus]
MDLYSSKRAVGWAAASRKGSGSGTRDTDCSRDEAAQFCNRLGCSGRLNYTKHTRSSLLNQPKPFRSSSRPSHSKEVASSLINVKKPLQESRKKLSSGTETSSTHSSSVSEESRIQVLNASAKLKSKSRGTESNKVGFTPVGRTVEMGSSNTKIRKVYGQKSGLPNQDAQITSFDSGRRRNVVKKRLTEGETGSSARGKKISGPSSDEGSSISDSRRSTNWTACSGSNVSSVRTRRSVNVDLSTRCIHQLHRNNPSPVQSTRVTPDMSQTEICWLSEETSSNGSTPNSGCTSSDTLSSMMPVASTEQSVGHFNDRHCSGRYNVDAIANVLLALERIEQDEELTYEEEFMAGDEIGRLSCAHGYHAVCINQWLQLKNWCPICKASAKPSPSA